MTEPFNAVEFVKGLCEDDREAVLVALLKEIVAVHTEGAVIPLETETENFGWLYPPSALQLMFERHGPKLTDEQKATLRDRLENPGEPISHEEMMARLHEAVEEEVARRESQSRGRGRAAEAA